MLSCGRVIGRLPKLTRSAQVNHLYRPVKYVGIVTVSNLRYSNDTSNKKPYKPPGTTIKPEECVPKSRYSKPERTLPLCESQPNASCPPSCYEVCGKPDNSEKQSGGKGFGKNEKPPYWKILATLIITGVTIYTISTTNWFRSKESEAQKDVSKKKQPKVPATSNSIPQDVPYLLIGGGTAAFSAFRAIKSRDPKAKVLVITEEADFPYMRPPLSKELWYNTDRQTSALLHFKQWNGTQRSIFYEPQEFYSDVTNLIESDKGGVAVATGWKVKKVDVVNKTVTLDDDYEIKYDKCLIATGASAKQLPVFDAAHDDVQDKIITFRTKEDFLTLEDNVFNPKCKNIVIVGGGFLGSELACSLARNLENDRKVYQVYKEKFIMAQVLPEYLSEWTTIKATSEGVHCVPNSEIVDYTYKNGRLSLVLTGNKIIDADQVVVAVGVNPNTTLSQASNLEVHSELGGYLVNAELEARSNVWVAGDAACFYDVQLGRRRIEHHDHAVISGRLAGENMTGAGKPYMHQSMFWSDLGPEVGYEAIGIVDSTLPTVGIFAKPSENDVQPSIGNTPSEDALLMSEEKSSSGQAHTQAITEQTSQSAKMSDGKVSVEESDKSACADARSKEEPQKYNDFSRGVIFYLRDDTVVGIVLWNIFNRMSVARQVLARGTKYDELSEIGKLFTIHDD